MFVLTLAEEAFYFIVSDLLTSVSGYGARCPVNIDSGVFDL